MGFLAALIPAAASAIGASAVGNAVGGALAPKTQAGTQGISTTAYGQPIQQALGQPNQTLQGQQALIQALQQQMAGGGPNLAATQLQAATDRGNKQTAGLIGSQRGLDPALAARQILQFQAQNQQAAANQAAQLRQQQQLAAQEQLGGVLAQQGQLGLGQLSTLGQLQNQQNQTIAGGQQANIAPMQAIGGGLAQGLGSAAAYSGLGQPPKPQAAAAEGAYVHDMKEGGSVPGKAKREGDHPENDTVHAMLSPGEIVLPRSIVKDADPREIQKFIAALKGESKREPGYGKVIKAKRALKDKE